MVQQLFSERIEWEWKIFKQEMMMTSKENVFMLAKTIFQKKRLLPVIVMLGSFVAVRFFSVNIIVIILVCGVIGAADTWHQGKMRKVGDKR